ncbi:hypothetical protein AAC387_Pa09g2478 [Persea americana]
MATAALPLLSSAAKSIFQFSSSINCRFTAALIGGKVYFPVFLRSERRKTGNWRYAAGTYGGSVSIRFLILFSLLLPVGGSWVGA